MKAMKKFNVLIMLTIYLETKEASSDIKENLLTNSEHEDFFSYFIREAPLHPGDYVSDTTIKDIPWLDVDLLDRASYYYKEQFPGISLGYLYSLVEVFALKSTTSVLLATGHFDNYTTAGIRLLKTVLHVREWCNSGFDVLDPSSNAFKAVKIIRNRHKSASYTFKDTSNVTDQINEYEKLGKHKDLVKAIQADLAHVDTSDAPMHLLQWNSTITPVGQFDLAVVQFLFYCHSTMNPEAFGVLHSSSSEDRRAFVHMWAVLGRLLGIQDRFNVPLNLPPHRHTHFYNNIVVASLKNIDETVIRLMSNTMDGWYATFLVPTVLRLKCWLFYALSNSVVGFTGQNIRELMNLEDEVCLLYLSATVSTLNYSGLMTHTSKLVFNNWFDKELERLHITY